MEVSYPLKIYVSNWSMVHRRFPFPTSKAFCFFSGREVTALLVSWCLLRSNGLHTLLFMVLSLRGVVLMHLGELLCFDLFATAILSPQPNGRSCTAVAVVTGFLEDCYHCFLEGCGGSSFCWWIWMERSPPLHRSFGSWSGRPSGAETVIRIVQEMGFDEIHI